MPSSLRRVAGLALVLACASPLARKGTPGASPVQAATHLDPLAACRLPVLAPRRAVALGMPRAPFRLKAEGDVRFAVLFVDFSDAPAAVTPRQAMALVSPAADFVEAVSYGKMRLGFAPHFRWLRMSRPSGDYGMARGVTFAAHKAYIEEAVRLAGDAADLRLADAVLVLANPAAKAIGVGPAFTPGPGFGIRVGDKEILNGVTSGSDLARWGWPWFAHEMGHTLSLVDLYGNDPRSIHAHVGEFGLMGLISGRAPEYFAWERWQLGWLNDEQVVCMSGSAQRIALTPVERRGGIKVALIPAGPGSAVAVESRRAEGYDHALPQPGVLVYRIDTRLGSQDGALRIPPAAAIDPSRFGSVLQPGRTLRIGGLSITFAASDAQGDTVDIVNDGVPGPASGGR